MITKMAKFQYDLQQGMSISEALTKHNLTFKQAFNQSHRPKKPRKKRQSRKRNTKNWVNNTGEKYIQSRDGHYYVRKSIKGETRTFGTYRTLEDAVLLRDYCMEHGWKQHSIDRYCEILGIERCTHSHKRLNRRYH